MKRLAFLLSTIALVSLIALHLGRFVTPEQWEYSDMARHWIAGRGMTYEYLGTSYEHYGSMPYAYLLGWVTYLTGAEWPMVLLQGAFLGLAGLAMQKWATLYLSEGRAWIAAALVVLHPGHIIYATKLHPHTLDVFLILAAVFMLSEWRNARLWFAVLTCVLAFVNRGTILPALLVWFGYEAWAQRHAWFRAMDDALSILILLIVFACVLPMRSDVAANLWLGNHLNAQGDAYEKYDNELSITKVPNGVFALPMSAESQSLAFLHRVRRDATYAPMNFASTLVRKWAYFWSETPHQGLTYPRSWLWLYRVYAVLFWAGAIYGLTFLPLRLRCLLLTVAACYSLCQAAFYVEGRHVWEIQSIFSLPFAAIGLDSRSGSPLSSQESW